MPDYSIRVNVPVVSLDVLVTTKDGQTIPGLKQGNFKIVEDGQEQKIATFGQTKRRLPPCCWWSSRRLIMTLWSKR